MIMFLYNFYFFNSYIYASQNNIDNVKNTNLELFCNSGLAMDFETGNVLYSNNATKKIYPASTTKILTCIIAIENMNLNDTTIISNKVIKNTPSDSSIMGIKSGELYTIEELLYGLMLPSGNDAALAIAEAVSNSTSNFVELMNKKAKELGCKETNFTNPHGYHDDNHYSTVYDMAIIFRHCLKNETFKKIISTNEITVKAANSDRILNLKNSNRMQNPSYPKTYYQDMKGGKTGYTFEARGTFIGYAIRDGKTVIAAAFDGSQNINGMQGRFLDTATLLDYSFSNYSKNLVINSNDYTFNIYDEKNKKCYTVKLENDVYGLFKELPNIEYSININNNEFDNISDKNKEEFYNKIIGTINFKYNFKDNYINTTSNISNEYNLVLIDVSNYITSNTIYKISFSIIGIFIFILCLINIHIKKKKKRKKKSKYNFYPYN